MKILITGGAGFIGSYLAERLVSSAEVVVLDDLSTGSRRNLSFLATHPRFRFVQGSVLDSTLVMELVRHADVVVHLAAVLGVRRILTEPLEAMRVNVEGTTTVLEASRRYGRKLLVASTSEVYGKSSVQSLCEAADSVIGDSTLSRWSYATAKKLDEFLALAYHRRYGFPVTVARFFNIVGPRQTGRYGMVLPSFVRAALGGEPLRVFGDGRQTRNFTSIWDCLDALVLLLSEPAADGEIFNIGGSVQISILDLANRVKALTGSSSRIEIVPYEKAYPEGGFEDMRQRVPCICKINRMTGWEPRVDLDTIILATAKHESRLAAGTYDRQAARWAPDSAAPRTAGYEQQIS